MSIIEETLNRLGEKPGAAPSPAPAATEKAAAFKQPVLDPQDEAEINSFNAMPWPGAQTAKRRSGFRLPVFVVAVAVVISGMAWYAIQLVETKGTASRRKLRLHRRLLPTRKTSWQKTKLRRKPSRMRHLHRLNLTRRLSRPIRSLPRLTRRQQQTKQFPRRRKRALPHP